MATKVIAFRASESQVAKLESIAKGERCRLSTVLRKLVDMAPVQEVTVFRFFVPSASDGDRSDEARNDSP